MPDVWDKRTPYLHVRPLICQLFPGPDRQGQRLDAGPGIRADSRRLRRGGNRLQKRVGSLLLFTIRHYLVPCHHSASADRRTQLYFLFILIAAIVFASGIHDSHRPAGREVQGPGFTCFTYAFENAAAAKGGARTDILTPPETRLTPSPPRPSTAHIRHRRSWPWSPLPRRAQAGNRFRRASAGTRCRRRDDPTSPCCCARRP